MSYSSRVLQKLEGRHEIVFSSINSEDEDAAVEDTVDDYKVNKFLLLNDSESEKETERKDDSEDESEARNDAVVTTSSSSSKPKRRKPRKKNRFAAKNNSTHNTTRSGEGDELDEILRQSQPSTSKQTHKEESPAKSVLIVEHRHLNPDNELRKIFGSRVLMGDVSYRRRMQGPSYKGVWLTQPQSNWAKLGKSGISMKLLETNGSVQTFKFEHSREYQKIQFQFLDAVDSSDHRNIATVLETFPYHVDALLTFSDVYKMHEDLKMARELIERCLYRLERSFHSCLNITTGKSRLPYKYQENRCVFLALYKHMNFVSQRGCNRTALELCKVLLSLDPEEDPLCSIFLFDYFALRSAQYEFLIQFSKESGNARNLSQLPNWAYSLSLALFHHSNSEGGSLEEADKSLQNSLIMFPSVLLTLLGKCSVQPDGKVASNPYFTHQARESSPQGLLLLCHLFVERNFALWKDPDTLAWLEKNVKCAMERIEKEDHFVRECTKKRKSRYQKPPLNVYRHALISELPDVSSLLPLEIRTGTMLSHDPLPPPNTVQSYERPARSPSNQRPRNPVSLFFQSLLPDFNPDDPQAFLDAHAQEDDADEGEGVRGNVQVLMNALRDLLHNFQQPLRESDEEDFAQDWD